MTSCTRIFPDVDSGLPRQQHYLDHLRGGIDLDPITTDSIGVNTSEPQMNAILDCIREFAGLATIRHENHPAPDDSGGLSADGRTVAATTTGRDLHVLFGRLSTAGFDAAVFEFSGIDAKANRNVGRHED